MSEFYQRELRDLQRTNGYPVPVRGAEVRATAADRFGRRHSDSDQASKLQSLRYLWTRIQGAPAPTKPSKRRMFVVWRCGQEGFPVLLASRRYLHRRAQTRNIWRYRAQTMHFPA